MYDCISVTGSQVEPERFEKGLAVEIHGNELSLYPVNITEEELFRIFVTLADTVKNRALYKND